MENEEYCRCKMEKRVLEGGEADAWATAQALPAYLKYVRDSGNKISKAQLLINRPPAATDEKAGIGFCEPCQQFRKYHMRPMRARCSIEGA